MAVGSGRAQRVIRPDRREEGKKKSEPRNRDSLTSAVTEKKAGA
jgi:hypothetical protein